MRAAEFRRLALSFSGRRGREEQIDMFVRQFGEVAVQQELFNTRLDRRIIRLRFNFSNYATQFESVAARHWFDHLAVTNAKKFLLQLVAQILEDKIQPAIWVAPFARNFLHRDAVLARAEERLLRGITRLYLDHLRLESC